MLLQAPRRTKAPQTEKAFQRHLSIAIKTQSEKEAKGARARFLKAARVRFLGHSDAAVRE